MPSKVPQPSSSQSGVAVTYLRVSTRDQAERDGAAEGYSLPAQRDACLRKAESLGVPVVTEFVDRGESGRSLNRPGLQAMLAFLVDTPVQYVIVHKVDRLARSRADDVQINLSIQKTGARLVSVTESIDETPSGILVHGIMSSIAEFYSRNLASEVLKGQTKKAEAGGTNGRAVVGYLNAATRTNSGLVRSIEVDPVRGPLMRWAFEAYATGEYSVQTLLEELTERGLTTAPMKTRPGKPLVRSHLLRLLRHPYYKGVVRFNGVESEGRHEPLVSAELWQAVQDQLDTQGYAGEKRRDHHHYLKGSVFCGQCESRLLLTKTTNRHGTTYWYFSCCGRRTGRTNCTQRAMPVEQIEELVEGHYKTVQLSHELRRQIREKFSSELGARTNMLVAEQQQHDARRKALFNERQKLLQAHYAGAIPLDLLSSEQARITQELKFAEASLSDVTQRLTMVLNNLDTVLVLLSECHRAYLMADDEVRRLFNQAFFEGIYVADDEEIRSQLAAPFSSVVKAGRWSKADADGWSHSGAHTRSLAPSISEPLGAFAPTGSYNDYMVELRGFEPLTFSLRTRRATNCATAPSGGKR